MAVYDIDGNYVAESLRKAGEILGISHMTVVKCSEKRGDDFYFIREVKEQSKRGPDTKPRKKPERTIAWWQED